MNNINELIKKISLDKGETINAMLLKKEIYQNQIITELMNNCTPYDVVNVAKYVKGISQMLISKIIISYNDPFYIYWYVKEVKNVPHNILVDAIIKMKNPGFIYWYGYYNQLDDTNIGKLVSALDNLQKDDFSKALTIKRRCNMRILKMQKSE